MKTSRRMLIGSVSATMLMVSSVLVLAPAGASTSSYTALTLKHGWTDTQFATAHAAVRTVGGIVQFQGAISTTGTNMVPFTLPPAFRPVTNVYVPVDLCRATNGRLNIEPTGVVTVQVEDGILDNAQCFTSLDGASFALTAGSFTPLTLTNGWTNAPFSTSDAAVRNINGIVHFKGAIATTGTNMVPFTLPSAFRPVINVYVPVDLCGATNGRLIIQPSGVVTVQAKANVIANAQCFTSLDGVSFARTAGSFTPLQLKHGWSDTSFGTAHAAVRNIGGIVHFRGAMSTTHKNTVPFRLPARFRPAADVYVKVDLCNTTNGRLIILPSGGVIVVAENNDFTLAKCFTSLDGVSFGR